MLNYNWKYFAASQAEKLSSEAVSLMERGSEFFMSVKQFRT